jgi:3-oxoacyl-[acyl-carrier-protein] synthase-1
MDDKQRVVVTGVGAVSPIGTGIPTVTESLRSGTSGLVHVPEWQERGLGSNVAGLPEENPECPLATRQVVKSSGSNARMCLAAAWEAIHAAGLDPDQVRGSDTALIIGSGTGSALDNFRACDVVERWYRKAQEEGRPKHLSSKRIHPFTVPRVMASTASANVSVALGLRGESFSVSSACSSGSHAIGVSATMIRSGLYERVITGASEEVNWAAAGAFDAMYALSRGFNDRPEQASRPFASDRDGFVLSGGAGVLIIESLETAKERGAEPLAELVGFGASSDGNDMVAPLRDGAVQAMRKALVSAGLEPGDIGYINAHGTSTPAGDVSEASAIVEVFGDDGPWVSSTKSTTGHAIGAAGSLEAIYTIQMLREGFLAPSVNVTDDNLDEGCRALRLVREPNNRIAVATAISNSFGFGGTNACLVLRTLDA